MKDITLKTSATIKEAMEALDKTAEKVLLLVDNNQKLIGTLSDGDIRRHILKGRDLTSSVQSAYNKNPIFISQEDFNSEKAKRLITENVIDLIPITDSNCRVVDFVTREKAFGNNRKDENKYLDASAVIMAGGKGTRLEPFTKIFPKPLVPVGEKPVIDHIIDRFKKCGVSNFYITIHHMSKILRAYFEEKNPDYSITFAEENEPRGTAGSLSLLVDKLDKPFFVSNCDIIIRADYSDIFNFHIKNNYDITLVASTRQYSIPYGICELNGNGSLERIRENPEYNYLVNTGLYVLNPNVIKLIPDNNVFHITQLIEIVKKKKGTVGVYPVSEKSWIDVGEWKEYRRALKLIYDN